MVKCTRARKICNCRYFLWIWCYICRAYQVTQFRRLLATELTLLCMQNQSCFTEGSQDVSKAFIMFLKVTTKYYNIVQITKTGCPLEQYATLPSTLSIILSKVAGAFSNPNGIFWNSCSPSGVMNAVFSRSLSSTSIFQARDFMSSEAKYFSAFSESRARQSVVKVTCLF